MASTIFVISAAWKEHSNLTDCRNPVSYDVTLVDIMSGSIIILEETIPSLVVKGLDFSFDGSLNIYPGYSGSPGGRSPLTYFIQISQHVNLFSCYRRGGCLCPETIRDRTRTAVRGLFPFGAWIE